MTYHELLNRLNALLDYWTMQPHAPKGVVGHLIEAKKATLQAIASAENLERAEKRYREARHDEDFSKAGIDPS